MVSQDNLLYKTEQNVKDSKAKSIWKPAVGCNLRDMVEGYLTTSDDIPLSIISLKLLFEISWLLYEITSKQLLNADVCPLITSNLSFYTIQYLER